MFRIRSSVSMVCVAGLFGFAFHACSSSSGAGGSPAVDAGSDSSTKLDGSSADTATGPSDGGAGDISTSEAADSAGQDGPAEMDANTCAGSPGEFHALPLESGGLTRHYFLYVPSKYDCKSAPWPLLIDFHGTASGTEADDPEEYYALPGMMTEADAEGFIVARPRSLSATSGGENIYQWDINPGDLQKNAAFAHDLVVALASEYHVDPARVYGSGFSNGTNMVSQFLADSPVVFHGIAVVGGGIWDTPTAAEFGNPVERIYAATGYREYLYPYQTALLGFLSGAGLPADHVFARTTNAAHELYGWHYRELFQWLDQGTRPGAGALASAWVALPAVPGGDDLLKVAVAPDGSRIVSAVNGDVWRQSTVGGAWTNVGHITGTDASAGTTVAPNLAGMCIGPAGNGVAVGNGIVAMTTNGGASWAAGAGIPPFGPFGFAASEFFTVACSAGAISGVGYTAVGYSTNGGTSWAQGSALGEGSFPGQLNTTAVGPSGTWIAGGYYGYLGRSTDGGETFTEVDPSPPLQWFNGLASASGGYWWAVGEAGSIFVSSDDGQTWTQQINPSVEDLYAVSFRNPMQGMAVGAHGAAVYTANGGSTWSDVSTGLDGYLGDVLWQDDSTILSVGANGEVLSYATP
jgi:photosystem II stability/assembly factor-like uncharacterized protein/predicted esterase